MRVPCTKDCPMRSSYCHPVCKDYYLYTVVNAEKRRKRKEENERKDIDIAFAGARHDRYIKIKALQKEKGMRR